MKILHNPISINLSIFTFLLFFHLTFCLDPFYEACVPRHCGDGHNITYPFFIRGVQQPFCGYPGFELTCNNGSSILQIAGNNFTVQNIYPQNSSVLLKIAAFSPEFCPTVTNSISLDPNRFRIDNDSKSIANLVFLWICSHEFPGNLTRYIIQSCEEKGARELVMREDDANLRIGMEVCRRMMVAAPVELRDEAEVVDGGTYLAVIERGFTARWLAGDCGECQGSGGRCGFNTTDVRFLCYCSDRPHRVSCEPERRHILTIVISATSAGTALILLVVMIILFRKKFKNKTTNNVKVETFLKNHKFLVPKRYSYSEVKKMTNSFKVKLGQGGFGSVYKGALSNGNLVAVKVLSESKGEGEDFINEVASVGKTSHVNIVNLLGFCFEGSQRALIYEFMPNGSLERFIYDRSSLCDSQLGWEKLHKIAIGIAQGLEYLHCACNTRILHFDIKPHNILLDKDFCPKISDFGLAKLFSEKRSMISMSHMRGTPGYIAPELFFRNLGGISHKSDVYSYGMMILEMVGGRKNIDIGTEHISEIYFPHWIYKKVELNEELGLHGIASDEDKWLARKMIIIGLWCIQTNPMNRPTITEVLSMLKGNVEALEVPPKPFFSSPSSSFNYLPN